MVIPPLRSFCRYSFVSCSLPIFHFIPLIKCFVTPVSVHLSPELITTLQSFHPQALTDSTAQGHRYQISGDPTAADPSSNESIRRLADRPSVFGPLTACLPHLLLTLPQPSAMTTNPQRPRGRDGLPLLNVAIQTLNLAKEVSSIAPAKVIFGSVSILLAMIIVRSLLYWADEFEIHVHPEHHG